MARKLNNKLDDSYESFFHHLNMDMAELEAIRVKATRDYNEVKESTNDNVDRIQLENIRANALKTISEFFKMRIELLKVHKDMIIKMRDEDRRKYEYDIDQKNIKIDRDREDRAEKEKNKILSEKIKDKNNSKDGSKESSDVFGDDVREELYRMQQDLKNKKN